MINILFIGCGKNGMGAHLPALQRLREHGILGLAGVCDLDPSRAAAAARKFGVRAYGTDWQRLVHETGAGAVSVCLPPGPNAEVSVQALAMGLHVLCEKPPGRDVRQADRMAEAALARPDRVTMVAFNRRYAPLYLRAVQHSLRLGPPQAFTGRFTRAALGMAPSDTATDWLTSDGVHALDLAVATIGWPHAVGVARRRVGHTPDNVWALHLHAEGASAVLLLDFSAGRRIERFEWTGPGYDVLLELPDRAEWAQAGQAVQFWDARDVTGSSTPALNYGFAGEYEQFVQAILGTAPRPPVDFPYGAAAMRLVKAILECPSGKIVPLPAPGSRLPATAGGSSHAVRPVHGIERGAWSVETGAAVSARPVVHVMQSPAGQVRYFSLEAVTRVAERFDLRLRSERNGATRVPGEGSSPASGIEDAEALLTGWDAPPLSAGEIRAASRLKLVIVLGASVRFAQPELLLDRGVMLFNTADAIGQSVAEHCLLLTLAGLRRLTEVDRRITHGEWPPRAGGRITVYSALRRAGQFSVLQRLRPVVAPRVRKLFSTVRWQRTVRLAPAQIAGSDLQGQVVGLVGWGHVARHFARLLQPFDCPLLVCSEHAPVEELESFRARRVSLGELLGASRVISLHKGLTDASRGMLGARELALIRPGSVLVNTARADLIDEEALVDRLRRGDIVAALDVFHQEPLTRNHPLRKMENVIRSPHSASSTPECRRRVGEQAFEILHCWLDGRPLPVAPVDRQRLARMT